MNYALAFNTFAHLIATSWVQTSTPLKSSLRHVLSSLGMGAMYIALMLAGNSTLSVHDLSLDQQVEKGHKGLWPLVLASALVGLLAVMKSFPFLYQTARSELSCIIWSIPYFVLLANPAPPTPIPLRHVYAKSPPQRVLVVPYSRAHPYEMSQNLSVPAIAGYVLRKHRPSVAFLSSKSILTFVVYSISCSSKSRLPATVVENAGQLLGKVSNFFSGFALLDRFFPQDSINERLHEKVRLALDEDGRKRHPGKFSLGTVKSDPHSVSGVPHSNGSVKLYSLSHSKAFQQRPSPFHQHHSLQLRVSRKDSTLQFFVSMELATLS